MFSANASQVSNDVKYIEDFCSVYLRTGTGSSQTVTTGVKENTGALVISKSRSAATDWAWYDTFRGATKELASNTTAAEITQSQGLTSFNTDGHTWGTLAKVNTSGATYVDFVLKPTPKFFDVVTYTGNGSTQNISHNLGSTPGCIIVKKVSNVDAWVVWHRSLANNQYLILNSTTNTQSSNNIWNNTAPTSTQFSVGLSGYTNDSSTTYVAYLFAHNAGGFGLTGTDNVISCGSFVGTGGISSINLGYEPQWLLFKDASSGTADWQMYDTMRGFAVGSNSSQRLNANTSGAETVANYPKPTATGFEHAIAGGNTCIYIAIRRGPMKTPTSGTSVFVPATRTGNDTSSASTAGFPVDLGLTANRGAVAWKFSAADRLRGATFLRTAGTNAEGNPNSEYTASSFASNTQLTLNGSGDIVNANANTYIDLMFRRAPGFFDVVCFTGTGTYPQIVKHNLGVQPELVIFKGRNDSTNGWWVGVKELGTYPSLYLNGNNAAGDLSYAVDFSVTNSTDVGVSNYSGTNYVMYLFASCPGVSKVGKYTGTGATQTINCGFTAGARFVLIKRTDSTGDWYVWDSARGIVAGNDPSLDLNNTSAEETGFDQVDPDSSGFKVKANDFWNTSGANFIFLAIA